MSRPWKGFVAGYPPVPESLPEAVRRFRSIGNTGAGGRAGFEWEVVTAGQVMGAFVYSEVSVFVVRGQYWDVLHRLFRHEKDGRVWLGTAHSREPLADFGRLAEWTEFSD